MLGSDWIFMLRGGGSCARPKVIRESLQALRDGEPRLLRLCRPEAWRSGIPIRFAVPRLRGSGYSRRSGI